MKVMYMLSGPLKNTGFPLKIKELLKKDLNNKKNIVFIPTSPDNFFKNDFYVYGDKINNFEIMDYLNEISDFKKVTIVDTRLSKEEANKAIKEADVLYLLGGNPFTQLEYIEKEKYDKLIQEFSGVIIGTSAGAMNLAKLAYYSKDEDYDKSIFYKALGIVDITIDPHFEIDNEIQVNEILINSKKREIIGLPNQSGIRIVNDKVCYIDKCYHVIHEKIKEIN